MGLRRPGYRFMGPVAVLAALLVASTGCQRAAGGPTPAGSPPVRFVDVTREAGIRFRHTSGRSDRYYLAQTMGAGCAFLDYNGDGRLDLFFVNSSRLPGFQGKGPFFPALYRNDGGGRFTDVTHSAGLAIDGYGMGVAVADYDNDGDPDLLLTAYRGSRLLRNDGGRFTDVTKDAGVTGPEWGTSAAWLDYDRDGHLDLFICNYLKWSPETNRVCGRAGQRYPCEPAHYPSAASVLYRSRGDGTFEDVTRRAKVDATNGKALGVVVWDFDDDGWLDLAVANDAQPNWLFRNNGDGTFTEMGVEAGVAYGPQGRQRAGMGIDTADFDHSGREALLIGNLSGEGLAYFQPQIAGQFADSAEGVGLFHPSLYYTTFGARFLDVDLDGYPDILTANGHVSEREKVLQGAATPEQELQLFRNVPGVGGHRRYQDVTLSAGGTLRVPRMGRGLAVGDYDGDGDPDVAVSTNNGAPVLLRNEVLRTALGSGLRALGKGASPGSEGETRAPTQSPEPRAQSAPPGAPHWLAVRLIGVRSNRDGTGARVRVTMGGQTQTGWVRSGGSYCSEDERVARFGLGTLTRVDRVEVRWPGGAVDHREGVPADGVLVIREGTSDRGAR